MSMRPFGPLLLLCVAGAAFAAAPGPAPNEPAPKPPATKAPAAPAPAPGSADNEDGLAAGRELTRQFYAGELDAVLGRLSDEFRAEMPREKLEAARKSVVEPPPAQQPHHGSAAPLVARRGDEAGGLVHGVVHQLSCLTDRPPVDADAIDCRIRRLANLRRGPVDRHATGRDQLLAPSPRGDSGLGEDLLQALSRHRRRRPARPSSPAPWPRRPPTRAAGGLPGWSARIAPGR